jgi:hypothetical protein
MLMMTLPFLSVSEWGREGLGSKETVEPIGTVMASFIGGTEAMVTRSSDDELDGFSQY